MRHGWGGHRNRVRSVRWPQSGALTGHELRIEGGDLVQNQRFEGVSTVGQDLPFSRGVVFVRKLVDYDLGHVRIRVPRLHIVYGAGEFAYDLWMQVGVVEALGVDAPAALQRIRDLVGGLLRPFVVDVWRPADFGRMGLCGKRFGRVRSDRIGWVGVGCMRRYGPVLVGRGAPGNGFTCGVGSLPRGIVVGAERFVLARRSAGPVARSGVQIVHIVESMPGRRSIGP